MARPYSDDLRRKLLEAFDQGKGSLGELWKISATRKRTGRMERPSYRPGAKRRIDESALAELLGSHTDATLVELQAELERKTGLQVSTQHLWRVVKRLGFRLKKVTPLPRAGHGREPQTARRVRRCDWQDRPGPVDLSR
jgi:transposase